MERFCKDCAHYTDAHFSRVYVTPICTVHGGDDCAFMRSYVCTLDGKLWEPAHADTQAKATSCQHNNG